MTVLRTSDLRTLGRPRLGNYSSSDAPFRHTNSNRCVPLPDCNCASRVRIGMLVVFAFALGGCRDGLRGAPHPDSSPTDAMGESERPEAPIDAKSDTNRYLTSGECRSNQDCNYVLVCVEPGGSVVGLCPSTNPPCNSDIDCQSDGGGYICESPPAPASCGTRKTCLLGCASDTDCDVGQGCSGFRCVPRTCLNDADCPTDFVCSTEGCVRKPCVDDSLCSSYCVKGLCYSTPGTCQQGVP